MAISVLEERQTLLCPLLTTLFEELDQARISYCLLRGYEELLAGTIDGDVDMLIDGKQLGQLRRVLERLGFVALARWGQAPHHFFIGYDERSDAWIKLDVVIELAYGRPIPALRTDLATICLERRVRYGPSFVPAITDEFLTLLLHCLLDKSAIEAGYRSRLALLARQIDDQQLAALLSHCFPPTLRWEQIRQIVANGEWGKLHELRAAATSYLSQHDRLGIRWRQATTPLLRFLDRRTRSFRTRGLTVALLAPDGAGKTTLARSLGRAFFLPTRYIYMGTNLKSDSIILPTTRLLARAGGRRQPLVRAINALNNLLEQGLRYHVGAYHRRLGRLVVFDRYTAGSLMSAQPGAPIHKRLRRWAMHLLCPPPDMVVYLDAPAEVLYQRKQEHSRDALERQRQRYLQILNGVARMTIVDASREPDQIRRDVAALIWRRYTVNMQKK